MPNPDKFAIGLLESLGICAVNVTEVDMHLAAGNIPVITVTYQYPMFDPEDEEKLLSFIHEFEVWEKRK